MKFEELRVRQEAWELYDLLHPIFEQEQFRHFYFKDQILRAALSISNNIAEWYESQTEKMKIKFLYISKWSAWEVRSMLYRACNAWFINDKQFELLKDKAIKISVMLQKLIGSLFNK